MNEFNLTVAHNAHGNHPWQAPWRWLSSSTTKEQLAALGVDTNTLTTQTGRGGGTWAPRLAMLSYLSWLDPVTHAALVRGEPIDLERYKTTASTETSRAVTGRLAGIENLRPGQAMRVPAPGADQPSLRSAVYVMGIKLGRQFSVQIKAQVATITRKREAEPAAPVTTTRPRRYPDDWVHYDPTNPQHTANGTQDDWDRFQAEAKSVSLDWLR